MRQYSFLLIWLLWTLGFGSIAGFATLATYGHLLLSPGGFLTVFNTGLLNYLISLILLIVAAIVYRFGLPFLVQPADEKRIVHLLGARAAISPSSLGLLSDLGLFNLTNKAFWQAIGCSVLMLISSLLVGTCLYFGLLGGVWLCPSNLLRVVNLMLKSQNGSFVLYWLFFLGVFCWFAFFYTLVGIGAPSRFKIISVLCPDGLLSRASVPLTIKIGQIKNKVCRTHSFDEESAALFYGEENRRLEDHLSVEDSCLPDNSTLFLFARRPAQEEEKEEK